MPGLTGNDMLVGIKQQRYSGPIIVTTKAGAEDKAIKAFRLGATDFLTKPLRPPEVLSSIEHALEDVKHQREKTQLLARLETANQDLQDKVKELTMLTNIGQILTGMRNIDQLFETVLSSMLDMTNADYASIILREPNSEKLNLAAGKNLSLVLQEQLGENIKDEVAELVLTSHEALVASGDGLQRFKLPRDTKAIVYAPMLAHGKAIGVLTIGNYKKKNEFSAQQGRILKAMADYVAIGITNARLFSALDMRARNTESSLQAKDTEKTALLEGMKTNVYQPLVELDQHLTQLEQNAPAPLKAPLTGIQEQTRRVIFALQELAQPPRPTRGIFRISSPSN
jgi:CheY-like chemotaxis protein